MSDKTGSTATAAGDQAAAERLVHRKSGSVCGTAKVTFSQQVNFAHDLEA
jgi:hypothetical protein